MPLRRGRQSVPHSAKAVEQNFGIGVGAERVAFGFQLFAQLAVVVDFAVERDYIAAICGEHGLMSGADWYR